MHVFDYSKNVRTFLPAREPGHAGAVEIFDQCALTRVEQLHRKTVEVAEGPEQVNALPSRRVDIENVILGLERQQPKFEFV